VFGVVEQLRDLMFLGADPPKTLVLGLDDVVALDATALHALTDLHSACKKAGTRFLLAGVRAQPRSALVRAGLVARFGAGNVADAGLKKVLESIA
jgi:SulP family sulfate permease